MSGMTSDKETPLDSARGLFSTLRRLQSLWSQWRHSTNHGERSPEADPDPGAREEQRLHEPAPGPESAAEPDDDADLRPEDASPEGNEEEWQRALAQPGARPSETGAPSPARFENIKVGLRKSSAGRCIIGVDIDLALDQPGLEAQELSLDSGESEDMFAPSREGAPAPQAARPTVKLGDVQPGQKNKSVLLVQKALAKAVGLDYSSGPQSFGPRTKAAYAKWQRQCGVPATGKPDPASLKKLGGKYGFTVSSGSTSPTKPSKGRMPGATWRPIPINHTRNGQQSVRGVVIHIMDGTLAGTDSWFRNKKAQASSHFGTGKKGELYQWVNTKDQAWAQRAGNRHWLSVENEGRGGEVLTAKQIERCAQILAWAHKVYGVPLRVANSPNERGLGHHSMGGSAWGHPACPGPRIIQQKQRIVDRAKQLVRARPAAKPAPHAAQAPMPAA